MDEIKVKVREFIFKHVRDEELGDDENMFELGYVNSLFAMQLVLFVEKEFGMTVSRNDLDFSNFRSIDAISSLVARGKGLT